MKHDFGKYTVHPAAELFPLLDGKEFDDLVQDIKDNGLVRPIMLRKLEIVDGRNRYLACVKAKVKPAFDHVLKDDDVSVLNLISSNNVHRRHLSAGQRAAIYLELSDHKLKAAAEERKAEHGGTAPGKPSVNNTAPKIGRSVQKKNNTGPKNGPSDISGRVDQQIAKIANVSRGTVAKVRKVAKESPKLAAKVRQGKITLAVAHRQVETPKTTTKDQDDKKYFKFIYDRCVKPLAFLEGLIGGIDDCERTEERIENISFMAKTLESQAQGLRRWVSGKKAYLGDRETPKLRLVK